MGWRLPVDSERIEHCQHALLSIVAGGLLVADALVRAEILSARARRL